MPDHSNIPHSPGCYLFKDEKSIIYIGKAKDLKKRVASYFTKKDHDAKTLALVARIVSIDFIATSNEVEALLLENNLIKKHSPKYNIDLKDSKRYAFIQVTDERFPRLLVARKASGSGTFYGPFVAGQQRDFIIQLLRRIFRIRTCKKLPKKECLRFHIKLCDAPCIGNISKEMYDEKIKNATMVLKGHTTDLLAQLKEEMKIASLHMEFEKAIEHREQINALDALSQRQNIERQRKIDEDILHYIVQEGQVFLLLFNIYKGTLTNKSEFTFDYVHGFLEEFLVQHYSEAQVPKELILPEPVDQSLQDFLSDKRGSKVIITIPKQGEKRELLELAKKNVELSFFGDFSKAEELQKRLRLQDFPAMIECFDISHLSGTSTVGSMVQFRNGKPDKSNYRRFRIRTVQGIDDFAAIAEVVKRRYSRLREENRSLPNLVVIDGGLGQLHSAMHVLAELGIRIPMISIAKRLEEIYVPGMTAPLRLEEKDKALQFIQEIRDEAHRFAIAYHRLLRGKN